MYQTYPLIKNVHSLADFEKRDDVNNVPYLQKPVRIAVYAVKKNDRNSNLTEKIEDYVAQYSLDLFKKQKTLDLKVKFESILKKDSEFIQDVFNRNGKMDTLLEIILKKRNFFQSRNDNPGQKLTGLNCDFVTYRGTLTNLLTCQYTFADSYVIYAELFKGTIYLQLEKVSI